MSVRRFAIQIYASLAVVMLVTLGLSNLPDGKHWLDFFQVFSVPSLAGLGIYFTWKNFQLSLRKRADELFDRRYQFYTKLSSLYYGRDHEANGSEETPGETEERAFSIRALQEEALFLFGRDIHDHCAKLADRVRDDCNDFHDNFNARAPFRSYLVLEK